MPPITGKWAEILKPQFGQEYYRQLYIKVNEEYRKTKIYPPAAELFGAFHYTPAEKVKAVILGQDPYHEEGQAHGLCFSVRPGVQIPPSLANIYKELHDDLGLSVPNNGFLVKWARQGVLLLNTVLTVRAHQANSHKDIGWQTFTDAVISAVDAFEKPVVFMLWGGNARAKKRLLRNPKHLVLEAAHPSPLSAYKGFFGCRHFSKANEFLTAAGEAPIDWQIENI